MEYSFSKEIMAEALDVLDKARQKGKVRVGVNEVTKAIERESAKLVLIAQDVSPKEIVMHLPLLCKEKSIYFVFVETKKELGEKAGLRVGSSSVAIVEDGGMQKEMQALGKKLKDIIGFEEPKKKEE